jgi:hypothetical protein
VVVRVTGRGEVGRGSRRRLRLPAVDLGFAAVDDGADATARGAASVAAVTVADGGLVHRPDFAARAS